MSFDHTNILHLPRSVSRMIRIRESRKAYARLERDRGCLLGDPKDDTEEQAAIRQRAREVAARTRRADRAAVLLNRGKTGLSDETETELTDAQAHHARAMEHHEAVVESHAGADSHITRLRAVHRQLTKTLKDLGIEDDDRVTRHMAAFDSHLNGLRSDHEDAADAHEHCGAAIKAAERCVRSVLVGGLKQSEPPSDDNEKDIEP